MPQDRLGTQCSILFNPEVMSILLYRMRILALAKSIDCCLVTSGSDPRGTRNADSDGRPKQSRTSEDESERRGIEAGVHLNVDKQAGGP